jgi:hypothetical protein
VFGWASGFSALALHRKSVRDGPRLTLATVEWRHLRGAWEKSAERAQRRK